MSLQIRQKPVSLGLIFAFDAPSPTGCQQRGTGAGKLLVFTERHLADFPVFERDGMAMVWVSADRIHPQQLASHLEPGDLLIASGMDLESLEVAKAHGVEVGEGLPTR